MISGNKIKRRVVAAKRKSDEEEILATERPIDRTPNHQFYPVGTNQDGKDRSCPKSKIQRRLPLSKNKTKPRTDQRLRHDREMKLFLVLSILGAVFVAVVCFTSSIAFEEGNKPNALFSSIVEMFPTKKDYSPDANEMDPLPTEFYETLTYFGDSHGDFQLNRGGPRDTISIEEHSRDFGGLNLGFPEIGDVVATDQSGRESSQVQSENEDYSVPLYNDDYMDDYYAFDDDYARNPFTELNLEEEEEEIDTFSCRRISEHRLYFPNCNSFHETPLLASQATFIGAGTYRQAMRIKNRFGQEQETIVVKDIHYSHGLHYDAYEFTRMDAIVAERLTSSPRIYNIYGACGVGIMSEYFPHGEIESIATPEVVLTNHTDDEKGPLICYNNLPGLTKLEISLHMAEALAELHGHSGGVIVHQDVKLDQFFFNSNKSGVVLNDFNRAEFMLWDQSEEKYCRYREGYGNGNWRAPEEYHDELLNEKVDVFSLGNNMYGLLTGLMVFHEINTYEEVQHLVGLGEKAFIDPRYKDRSLAEAKIVEIIEKCHEYYEEERPSIFEVVDLLWEALEVVYEDMDATDKEQY